MAHLAGQIVVDAPIEQVFDLVADERNEPLYNPRMVRAEKVSPGPVGTGTRFVTEPRGTGARGEMTVDVLEYERPHRLRTAVRSSYLRVDGTVTFEPVAAGTRLRWDWELGLTGAVRVLLPVMLLFSSRWERRNWVGLKAYVESGRHEHRSDSGPGPGSPAR